MAKHKKPVKPAPKKMAAITTIIKRRGHSEKFDERKLYGSCYFAARNCEFSEKESEKMAQTCMVKVHRFLKGKKQVSSQQLFEFVGRELSQAHKDVGFMYLTHRDVS